MKDADKKVLLIHTLWEYWDRHPYLRLGQIIYNTVAPTKPCPEIFYIEDRELQKLLENEL